MFPFFTQAKGSAALLCLWSLLFMSACGPSDKQRDEADRLNDASYVSHYTNLDSTRIYAQRALAAAGNGARAYGSGQAEALNNLAFVSIAQMDYQRAYCLLDSVHTLTDNYVELLVADIQLMRLCQRESRNKEFYTYKGRAERALQRIAEDGRELPARLRRRMVYARSEYALVTSTYYYYVGMADKAKEAVAAIDVDEIELTDAAQYCAYLYYIGSGGIIDAPTPEATQQEEWEQLVLCYAIAREHGYVYWQANAMQALSEHLSDDRGRLVSDNTASVAFVNEDDMPDSLLAGYLAQRSLEMFDSYGDVYQRAGAWRTLAACHWAVGDNISALICLEQALTADTAINQAPDLVASIRERLSITWSAMDDKQQSDINRNIYLDIQEDTRRDRQLEARAEQLQRNAVRLNTIIAVAVTVMLLLVVAAIILFVVLRRRKTDTREMERLLTPLRRWQQDNERKNKAFVERIGQIDEARRLTLLRIQTDKRLNMDNRAKIALVNSQLPLIDRMINELARLKADSVGADSNRAPSSNGQATVGADSNRALSRNERLTYIAELVEQINAVNAVLTDWIKLRQGQLSLKIESFPVQDVLDIVGRSTTAFRLKGVELHVDDSTAVVKADKTLTLFMLNTMADNARKYTPQGGNVTISADETADYVELAVTDTGVGMSKQQTDALFATATSRVVPTADVGADSNRALSSALSSNGQATVGADSNRALSSNGQATVGADSNRALSSPLSSDGHGFGLMNCKGIIDKYRKTSRLFNVCTIGVQSEQGRGSRFFFRLPKGIARVMTLLCLITATTMSVHAAPLSSNGQGTVGADSSRALSAGSDRALSADSSRTLSAADYADSAYYSNIGGNYGAALQWADSARQCLDSIAATAEGLTATDNDVLLSVLNETAVAALALHDWRLYSESNARYTQLYKELSQDSSLADYVSVMQRAQTNKTVAIALLLLLLAVVIVAYYTLYYRQRLHFRFCMEQIDGINNMLTEDITDAAKLDRLNRQMEAAKERGMAEDDFPDSLKQVVALIRTELENGVRVAGEHSTSIEIAEDELRRVELESQRLHVSNNIIDNCLSTLKHETMYYPSRIRQLLAGVGADVGADSNRALPPATLNSIDELARYYRQLYAILSRQAMSQLAAVSFRGDKTMMAYLLELLATVGADSNRALPVVSEHKDDTHSVLTVELPQLEWRDFFEPKTENIPFLVCRQIVRDYVGTTSAPVRNGSMLHGCGIATEPRQGGGTVVKVTIINTDKHG